jgi:hypothetical protein
LQAHRQTDRFFESSGVQLEQSTSGQFHYRRAAFSSQLKSKIGNILAKAAALLINLNIDGAPITSKSHTHPSHSQTFRLLTSSLFLGVPVPRASFSVSSALIFVILLQINFLVQAEFQLETICALVPPTRVPRMLTIGRLIKSLTSFAQHTRLKLS